MSPKATRQELMIIAVAREIKDYERILLGVGLPTTAGGLAKATHAPNSVLMTEAGIIDFKPLVPPNHIADVMCLRGFSYALDLFNTFTTINYRGFVDKAILGVGQVDLYGNINTSFIGGTPKTGMRLTGAGGAPDFISYAKETILTLKGGEFVEKLDYFTSPGYMGGGEERNRCGLFRPESGPSMMISTEAVFRFDRKTKEVYLESLLPGVDLQKVKSKVPWDLRVVDPLKPFPTPTEEEIDYIRTFAPQHCIPRDIMMELAVKKFFEFAGGKRKGKSG
ncbi:MAG: glutaconate CoA-transferase [Deltaproteobacteria bacterium]|nr:glutaconate CoA-transferase [Deltaproteobacteria bacterium]